MFTATLNYWEPEDVSVVTEDGFRFLSRKPVIKRTQTIAAETEISLFEQFYELNNRLRYCNGSSYKWQDPEWEAKYQSWRKSDDYKKKSFNLFYGNGVVD